MIFERFVVFHLSGILAKLIISLGIFCDTDCENSSQHSVPLEVKGGNAQKR